MTDKDEHKFDLQIRAILENAREDVPDGVWAGIEGRLSEKAAHDEAASGKRKVHTVPVWFRISSGAAAAAAVAAGLFISGIFDDSIAERQYDSLTDASGSRILSIREEPWARVAENLPDMNAQAPVGIYESTVPEMHENYIKPQDNGNHGGTKYLRLTDTTGTGLQFFSASKFSFSVHDYTQALLSEAKHREDLRAQNTTFLSIDGFMRGAGSNACGPDALEQYRFTFRDEIEFKFAVQPVNGKKAK